jgi:hypothetical protein
VSANDFFEAEEFAEHTNAESRESDQTFSEVRGWMDTAGSDDDGEFDRQAGEVSKHLVDARTGGGVVGDEKVGDLVWYFAEGEVAGGTANRLEVLEMVFQHHAVQLMENRFVVQNQDAGGPAEDLPGSIGISKAWS